MDAYRGSGDTPVYTDSKSTRLSLLGMTTAETWDMYCNRRNSRRGVGDD